MNKIICEAINAKRCLELSYDGYSRVVEAHAYGITKEGNEIMRVWQVRGGSQHNEREGWKLLRLDEVHGLRMINEVSQVPRPKYARGDKAMQQIFCQI